MAVPTVRHTLCYRGDEPLPEGTPESAEWKPDHYTYHLYLPVIYTSAEEWCAAVEDLRAGNFPSEPSPEHTRDPFDDLPPCDYPGPPAAGMPGYEPPNPPAPPGTYT